MTLTDQAFFIKRRGQVCKVVSFMSRTEITETAGRLKAYIDKKRVDGSEFTVKPITNMAIQLVDEFFEK